MVKFTRLWNRLRDYFSVPTKDVRWIAWNYTHERFERTASMVTFHQCVPEDVVRRFEIVKKLILHSYYEYEFLDLAYERALTTFEMALRIRHEQIAGTKWKGNFENLITWGSEQQLFDKGENFIQPLRKIRNMAAHPKEWNLIGFAPSIDITMRVVEVINFMFPRSTKE